MLETQHQYKQCAPKAADCPCSAFKPCEWDTSEGPYDTSPSLLICSITWIRSSWTPSQVQNTKTNLFIKTKLAPESGTRELGATVPFCAGWLTLDLQGSRGMLWICWQYFQHSAARFPGISTEHTTHWFLMLPSFFSFQIKRQACDNVNKANEAG